MPTGVYIRIKPRSKKQLEVLSVGREIAHKKPRNQKQIKHIRELGKKVKTEKQIETSRKNIQIANKLPTLPKTQKQIESSRKNARTMQLYNIGKSNPHGPTIFGDDIIRHHNDLQHGALRPDDMVFMTASEHTSLHNKLRVQNGTHNFLGKLVKEVKNNDN